MKFKWSRLFRSEKARIKPVLMQDVEPAPVPNKELEKQQDTLSLRLMAGVVQAAVLSGKIRESAANQAALQVQGRSKGGDYAGF